LVLRHRLGQRQPTCAASDRNPSFAGRAAGRDVSAVDGRVINVEMDAANLSLAQVALLFPNASNLFFEQRGLI
jgi:hypothetical protein